MNRFSLVWGLSMLMVVASGCATKSYVRKQVEPIINKVNELDQRTAENTNAIKHTDTRLQQDLQTLNTTIDGADKQAAESTTRAKQAQESASSAQTQAAALSEKVDGLDTYHVVSQVAVQFAVDQSQLDPKAKQQLDEFSTQLAKAKDYVVVVEGRTDAAGSNSYNDDLSDRRAAEVVRYLVSKHDLPQYKVHAIGLGKARPVAGNNTADGRKANRRADITLMSNNGAPAQGNNANDPTSDDEVGLAIHRDRR